MWESPVPHDDDAFEADLIASTNENAYHNALQNKRLIWDEPLNRLDFDEEVTLRFRRSREDSFISEPDYEISDLLDMEEAAPQVYQIVADDYVTEDMADCCHGCCRTNVEDNAQDSTFVSYV